MEFSKTDKEYLKHINRIFNSNKYVKDFFGITDDALVRQFKSILTKKEKMNFMKELTYQREIYRGVEQNALFKALLNKYKKIKFHKVVFLTDYQDINEYIELRRLEMEYEDMFGSNFNEDLVNGKIDLSNLSNYL
jgi:hypothetical protein